MNIYVASRFADSKKVRDGFELLQRNNHTIAADWTVHTKSDTYSENAPRSISYAIEDINAVNSCDVFILILSEKAGSGSTTEFGAALSRRILTKKPEVYIVGDNRDQNMFFFHPEVKIVSSVQEVIDDLSTINHQ